MSCYTCCLFPSLAPTWENITDDEFQALGDMLSSMKWELPEVQEYKGDLAQPPFLIQGLANQQANMPAIMNKKPSPEDPATDEQWGKVQKMAA